MGDAGAAAVCQALEKNTTVLVILMCESEEIFNKFFRSQKKFISVTSQVLGPFLGLYLF